MHNEQDGSEEERQLLDLLSQSVLNDYPNPERIGCPGESFLQRLARNAKSIPPVDPQLDHVLHCSPCFQELAAFKTTLVTKSKRRGQIYTLAASLAAVLLVGAGLWLANVSQRPAQSGKQVLAEISLQERAIVRGNPKQQRHATELRIPRGNLRLGVLLPFGSEPGRYEIELLKDANSALLSSDGTAQIVDGTTKLEVGLDTSNLSPGKYLLGIRQPPLDWTLSPILVQ